MEGPDWLESLRSRRQRRYCPLLPSEKLPQVSVLQDALADVLTVASILPDEFGGCRKRNRKNCVVLPPLLLRSSSSSCGSCSSAVQGSTAAGSPDQARSWMSASVSSSTRLPPLTFTSQGSGILPFRSCQEFFFFFF